MTHDRPAQRRHARQARRSFDFSIASIDRRAQRPQDDAIDGSGIDLCAGCGGCTPLPPAAKKGPRRR